MIMNAVNGFWSDIYILQIISQREFQRLTKIYAYLKSILVLEGNGKQNIDESYMSK